MSLVVLPACTGKDASSPPPRDLAGPRASPSATLRPWLALDTGGATRNEAAWQFGTGKPGVQQEFYELTANEPGSFFVVSEALDAAGCDVRAVRTRRYAGRLGGDGRVEAMHRLDVQEAMRLTPGQRLLLVLEGEAPETCGDVHARFAARYLPLRTWDPSSGGTGHEPRPVGGTPGPEADADAGAPDAGELPVRPIDPPTDGSHDGSSDGGAADTSPDGSGDGSHDGSGDGSGDGSEPPPPPPPPPTCDPNAADPNTPAASIRILGRVSARDACSTTFTWNLREAVKQDPRNDCKRPAILYQKSDTPPLLKIQTQHPDLAMNVAWLQLRSTTFRDAALAAIRAGRPVYLQAPEPTDLPAGTAACAAPAGATAYPLESDLDVVLFQGDPREQCFADRGAVTTTELGTPRDDLRASYKYDARTNAGLKWQAELKLPADVAALSRSLKFRLFHRRTRKMLTDWSAVERLDANRIRVETSAFAVAAQVIPEQRDVEIILGQFGTGAACTAVYSIPYAKYFLDAGNDAAFRDLTRPGHSRFSLPAADMP